MLAPAGRESILRTVSILVRDEGMWASVVPAPAGCGRCHHPKPGRLVKARRVGGGGGESVHRAGASDALFAAEVQCKEAVFSKEMHTVTN